MKKVRIFLGATALMLTVGATFAFSAHRGAGNTYFLSSGTCTLDEVCASGGSGGCANTATHYTTRTNGVCSGVTTALHTVAF